MDLSYWEIKEWFTNVDFTIVGSGIVGLSTALFLKEEYPKASILILEKGILPKGASTKNAGFACFGSISEILDDLNSHSEKEVFNLVKKRWDGLHLLRKTLGDKAIDFLPNGGYELFNDQTLLASCIEKQDIINQMLHPIFKTKVFTTKETIFGFKNIEKTSFFNTFEGQINTGKMMSTLLKKVQSLGVKIIANCTVSSFTKITNTIQVHTNIIDFSTKKLIIATNGFSKHLISEDVVPARAQVLITKPIENLAIKGTFHLQEGYYYFRNIDNRILFGGGRNLDFKTEETTDFSQTEIIQNSLESLLKNTILPNTPFEIEHRWSGIMGIGNQKKAIVKEIEPNVYCGVRLGGMGIAIGMQIGKEVSQML